MNIEEIDKWLENEYGVSYTRLEELHDFVIEQDLKHQEKAQQELGQYKNNWEELKKWVKEQDDEHQPYYGTYEYNGEYEDVLDKMKELEEE